jgi:EAL domain-containing protein (putative c-di-GMP-specific phosphodiesterase class I)/CheY-like chemotaxis protein/GGDEF domain-containing protein
MQPHNTRPETADDNIAIIEDDAGVSPVVRVEPRWKILVVDDDAEVHTVTRFVLGNSEFLGRRLELIEARSAGAAQSELQRHRDIAVILLDVVMEEHDSGLKLARWVRESGLDSVRIILRTGQPGYAPELDVIRDYDINDYRAKSELTQTRLITSMTAALRSYQQIETIERSRRGLEMIVSSCSQLFQKRELASFSQGVLLQIASLCGIEGDGIICSSNDNSNASDPSIVSGVGAMAGYIGRGLSQLPDGTLKTATLDAIRRNMSSTIGPLVLSVETPPDRRFIASLEHSNPLDEMDTALLGVFSANIAVGFENVGLIERLDRLAYWDETADLPNRHRLLQDAAELAATTDHIVLVRVVTYSDTLVAFGQATATGLLCEIAAWLKTARGGRDIYRFSEDVLGLIVTPGTQQEAFLSDLRHRQFSVKGQVMRARFAVGSAQLGSEEDAADTCDRAYAAMALAAAEGREEVVRFDTGMVRDARDRIELTAALRTALEDGQVDIVFQPLVEMATGTCTGFEALARWSRNGKPVSPAHFIPLAEQVGLSLRIFELGVRRSAQWIKKLQSSGRTGHYVSVNLAACDLEREDLVPFVVNLLGHTELPPAQLQIEITEQSLIRDFNVSERNLRALKNLGCRIAIDDFGTGYSSLSYIGKLPVDVLKLDRQFVTDILDSPSSQAIVSLTAALAQRLKLEVLAEGVETAEQQEALEKMGIKYAQGYRFARPQPFGELYEWIEKRRG